MEGVYRYILDQTVAHKIERQTAIELVQLLKEQEDQCKDIAVIGMALRFPMAADVGMFWANLREGKDCITAIPEARKRDLMEYMRFRSMDTESFSFQEFGYIDDIDAFDYEFFRISPKEASLMDPSQRIFLQVAWNALEDGGYAEDKIRSTKTGVFVGYSDEADYLKTINQLDPSSAAVATAGNLTSAIASRICHILDLTGPSMMINTACSSALAAIHYACQSLRNGECNLALAGAVKLSLFPVRDMRQRELDIFSSNARTSTFDAKSDGTGIGEGVAAVLLKPLSQAIKDRDAIYAIIRGSAVNHDGRSIGFTSPKAKAQEQVILEAWKQARINPLSVTLWEAHGTGTKIGDPIEVQAIHCAFNKYTDRRQFCAIGSVKTNIGHLDSAAGIAGFIKAVLSLQHRQIPPTIHFDFPNKEIAFESSPLYVNDKLAEWATDETPRICGISAFGLSGTNCHMVLQEYQKPTPGEELSGPYIFTLSAITSKALIRLLKATYRHIQSCMPAQIADLCYTTHVGRWHHPCRLALLINSLAELSEQLHELLLANGSPQNKDICFSSESLPQSNLPDGELEAAIFDIYEKGARSAEAFRVICRHYVAGAAIDWECFHRNDKRNTERLPVYPFEKTRCWLDMPYDRQMETFFHGAGWEKSLDCQKHPYLKGSTGILVLSNGSQRARKLITALQSQGIQAEFDTIYDHSDHVRSWNIRTGMAVIFACFPDKKDNNTVQVDSVEATMNEFLLTLRDLRSSVAETGAKQVRFILLTGPVYNVTGGETQLYPNYAVLIGLCRGLFIEDQNMEYRCIDVGEQTDSLLIVSAALAEQNAFLTALRGTDCYVHCVADREQCSYMKNIEVSGGVCVITGGTGLIGQEVAMHLALSKGWHIAIISRSENIPPSLPEVFNRAVNDGRISYHSADVTHRKCLADAIKDIRRQFGAISHVIHCAGSGVGVRQSFFDKKDVSDVLSEISAKVNGAILIDELTSEDSPDLILFSSMITMVGGAGSTAYIGANAFLDAFAAYRNTCGKRTVSIGWAMWNKTFRALGGVQENNQFACTLTTEEALRCLDEILDTMPEHILVGRLNHSDIVLSMQKYLPLDFSRTLNESLHTCDKPQKGEKVLKDTNVKPAASDLLTIKKEITRIWKEVLGYQVIKPDENFFQIGGDSILLMQLHEKIDELFPNVVAVTELFKHPTLEMMVQCIADKSGPEESYHPQKIINNMLNRYLDGELSINSAIEQYQRREDTKR